MTKLHYFQFELIHQSEDGQPSRESGGRFVYAEEPAVLDYFSYPAWFVRPEQLPHDLLTRAKQLLQAGEDHIIFQEAVAGELITITLHLISTLEAPMPSSDTAPRRGLWGHPGQVGFWWNLDGLLVNEFWPWTCSSPAPARSTIPEGVSLVVVQGRPEGKSLCFPPGEYVFGRSGECHIRPNSDWVSKRHCLLRVVVGEGVFVRDLGSRNGTLVNGVRISAETDLAHGDRLQVGPLVFQIRQG